MDHPLSKHFENDLEYQKFKEECSKTGTTEESIAQAEKIGFKTNLLALNPMDPKIKVPVYFANFVLMDYGFGAVFGCPAHDQRDFEFAKKYKLLTRTEEGKLSVDSLNTRILFTEQLGPYWQGVDVLPKHQKAIFAALCLFVDYKRSEAFARANGCCP